MGEQDAGRMQGENGGEKPGVDPTRPIGPGNPPAAGMWQEGQSGNPAGKKPGTRAMAAIARDILDAERSDITDEQKKLAALFLGRADVESVTNRELMLLRQVQKAITKGSTEAFKAIALLVGELKGEGGIPEGCEVIILKPNGVAVDASRFKDDPDALAALAEEQNAHPHGPTGN